MRFLLNRELISRLKLCLVSGFPHIAKDYPKMRNLPKFFLRSFENMGPGSSEGLILPPLFAMMSMMFTNTTSKHHSSYGGGIYPLHLPHLRDGQGLGPPMAWVGLIRRNIKIVA